MTEDERLRRHISQAMAITSCLQHAQKICDRIDLHEKMAQATGQWQRAGQDAFDVISKL